MKKLLKKIPEKVLENILRKLLEDYKSLLKKKEKDLFDLQCCDGEEHYWEKGNINQTKQIIKDLEKVLRMKPKR